MGNRELVTKKYYSMRLLILASLVFRCRLLVIIHHKVKNLHVKRARREKGRALA